ncbi:MAG: hypothetical protein HY518_04540 [Candidatus Aenigmarchaeota archaeon]|nr:hypothetical protein [Candidatus Aenigmarchaeota archaeon]
MNKDDCSGRCIIGGIVAIIFGALFLMTLVYGFLLQQRGGGLASVYGVYVGSLIFLGIAKWAMWYSKGCKHCMVAYAGMAKGMHREEPEEKPKSARRRR